jgi:hypothetical protein
VGSAVGGPTKNFNLTSSGVINTLGYNAVADNSGADDGCDIGAFERGAQPFVLDFADGFEDPPEP